jgi:hypothetical protein
VFPDSISLKNQTKTKQKKQTKKKKNSQDSDKACTDSLEKFEKYCHLNNIVSDL